MKNFEFNHYAKIEIKHIYLELKNGRTHHMRHFIDQYFCFKNGYARKSGTAIWEGVVWKEYVSEEVRKINDRKLVVKEHVIPLKRIIKELVKISNSSCFSEADISICLDSLVIFATITKDEDKLLRNAKLNSSMPEEYDEVGNDLFQDRFARYKKVGIEVSKYKEPK